MRKIFTLLTLIYSLAISAQGVLIKTNLPYAATLTPNLGVEFGLSKSLSFNIEGSYNPFEWSENKYHKHFLVIPELRYWTCYKFNKSFFGLHGLYGKYNLDDSKFLDSRFEGDIIGAGLVYGYHLYLNKNWGLEFLIGLGYAHLTYNKYECGKCGESQGYFERDYVGPTRAAISLVYIL